MLAMSGKGGRFVGWGLGIQMLRFLDSSSTNYLKYRLKERKDLVTTEWVPPEVGLVGRGVGVGGVGGGSGSDGGCLGQNQYCGHPSLGTPCLIPNSLLLLTHLRLRSKSEDEAEVADVAWRGEDGCRCRVITTLKTQKLYNGYICALTIRDSSPLAEVTIVEKLEDAWTATGQREIRGI
ncbi:hypothetical protein M0802_009828 [Mischocyttarus mexicanus]|nr:hypothetical protein M0802_009828 [Mischocyttarus mexicanus]